MAEHDFSAAPHADAHPMANPGYGKRNASDQPPARKGDFAHLTAREASIAAYLDQLPEGADISVKTLAKHLPYGQCALRTALRRLSEAGHLRRVKEHLTSDEGSLRWVTRTYFTRTARDDAWWAAFQAGQQPDPTPPPRSRAYDTLAALGRTEPRMTLSAADCADLEPLATQWLTRHATPAQLTNALTSGLPPHIHHPAALARTRLTTKMPPEPAPAPAPAPPPRPCASWNAPSARPPAALKPYPAASADPAEATPHPAHHKAPRPPTSTNASNASAPPPAYLKRAADDHRARTVMVEKVRIRSVVTRLRSRIGCRMSVTVRLLFVAAGYRRGRQARNLGVTCLTFPCASPGSGQGCSLSEPGVSGCGTDGANLPRSLN
ncbi:hypothetical protein [Streptomyces gobiensis]|uniref:hypothetical protein n=1 Tax=Streptomyces gobiensis TaxID=2875706 RepID=UPI0030CCF8CE